MIIYIVVAVVVLFCCCPTICSTVWWTMGTAIQAALGIGAAAQQKKAIDDANKQLEDAFKNIDKTKGK